MSKIKKELKRFLVAGISAVGTDLVTYGVCQGSCPFYSCCFQ